MRKRYSLGVDVIEDSVRGILLKKKNEQISVLHTFEGGDPSVLCSTKIRSSLRGLSVVTAISKVKTIEKILQLPINLSEYEIECEISDYVKNNYEDDFYFEFFVVGVNDVNDDEMDVKIILSNKKDSNKILNLISKANLKTNIFEIRENMIALVQVKYKKDVEEKYYAAFGCALRGFDQ